MADTSIEWTEWHGSPGVEPLGKDSDLVKTAKKLEAVSELLGVVLEVLGVVKKFAGMLEDPLTALIVELEQKVKSYMQDKAGFYLSHDINRLKRAYANRPLAIYNPNAPYVERKRAEFQSFLAFLQQFKGIDSFNREYYKRLTDTTITPRPIAYNSTVAALFITLGGDVDAIKPIIQLLLLIENIWNFKDSEYTTLNGLKYGFTLKPAPGDAVDIDNTIHSYLDVVQGVREVQELSITVDADLLSSLFEDYYLVLYTNPEGFLRFADPLEKANKSEKEDYRVIYHFHKPEDLQHLVYDDTKTPPSLKNISEGNIKVKDTFEENNGGVINTESCQHIIDLNQLIPVSESLIDSNIWKLKYPQIKPDGSGIDLINNPTDKVYARVYFSKSKKYSAPLVIRKPVPVDFEGVIKTITASLIYYMQFAYEPPSGASPSTVLADKLRGRIPEDLMVTVRNYCLGSAYLFNNDSAVSYKNILANDMEYVALCNAVAEYPYLLRVFNISKPEDFKIEKDALIKKLNDSNIGSRSFLYKNPVPDMSAEIIAFFDKILIAKFPTNAEPEDPNAIWKNWGTATIPYIKQLSDRLFRFLKEFADSLKGAGQGIVKFITNLERYVNFLKTIVDFINLIIKIFIELYNALSGDFSINLLYFPDANGEAASSTQDLANKLISSQIPQSDDLNSNNLYYLGGALVFTSGIPNILTTLLSTIVVDWAKDDTTAEEEEEVEV
jgi:hypothetical protein